MTRATRVSPTMKPMTTVLMRSEQPDPILTAAEVADWPHGTREQFVRLGVLAETSPAESFACDACGFDHVEQVQWHRQPGLPARVCIACAKVGIIWLNPADLDRWTVRPLALAQSTAAAIGSAGSVSERVAGRVWKLGTLRVGGRAWVGFLAVGLTRPDGAAVVESVPELRAPNALVLVPSAVPPPTVWGPDRPPV